MIADGIITRKELVKHAKDADGILALLTEKYDKENIIREISASLRKF